MFLSYYIGMLAGPDDEEIPDGWQPSSAMSPVLKVLWRGDKSPALIMGKARRTLLLMQQR